MEPGADGIDEDARRRFESHRYGGGSESVASFLPHSGDPRRAATLEELLLIELEFRWKAWLATPPDARGGGPSIDDLIVRYTERGELDDEAVARIRDEERPLQARFAARVDVQPGARIGRYTLSERAGRGATAEVWRARDDELQRDVAVKIAKAELAGDDLVLARLLREAQSAAQLRHPSIVTVHEVAQHAGQPFIVSDFIDGPTLAGVLRDGPLPPGRAARLAAQLADALAYAHGYGVVHRDVKPGNVLMAADDRPVLTDFGLAHFARAESHLTRQGDVLGTPAYMAPEQARGDRDAVDQRSDVYGLGAVLFEMLSGRPPFVGDTAASVLYAVVHSRPPSLASLGADVPADLETICLRALAREPSDRYPDARAFADDLRRFLAGEPVLARPPGPWRRLRMWARRNPAIAGTIVVSATAIALVTGIAFDSVLAERDLARANHFRALVGEADARLSARETGWYGRTMEALREAASLPVADRDDLALRNLVLRAHGILRPSFELRGEWQPPAPRVRALDVGPAIDGRARPVVGASAPDLVWIARDDGSGSTSRKLPDAQAHDVAWVRSGRSIAVAAGPQGVLVLDGATLATATTVPIPGGARTCVVAPGGRRIAAAGDGGPIVVLRLDAADGPAEVLQTLDGHEGGVLALGFAPDGERLVSTGRDSALRVWNTTTGRELHSHRTNDPARTVAFSPDGVRIAFAAPQNFGLGIGSPEGPFTDKGGLHRAGVRRLAFTARTRIVTASSDGTLRSFDTEHRQEAIADVEAGQVRALAGWGDAGVLSAHADGRVRRWEIVDPPGRQRFTTSHRVAYPAGPDGFFTGSSIFRVEGGTLVGGGGTGDSVQSLIVRTGEPPLVGVLRSGTTVTGTPRELHERPPSSGSERPLRVAVSPSGKTTATWLDSGEIRVERSGRRLESFTAPDGAGADGQLAVHDDGLVAMLVDGRAILPERENPGQRNGPPPPIEDARCLASDGRAFYVGTGSGQILRWLPVYPPTEKHRLPHAVAALGWAEGRLAVGDARGRVHLFDRDGARQFRTGERPYPARSIVFGPGGDWIAVTWKDRSSVLDGRTGAAVAELFSWPLTAMIVTPEGDVLGGTHLGGVWRWDAAAVTERVERHREERAAGRTPVSERLSPTDLVLSGGHATQTWGVAASADGRWLATSSHAGWIKLWDATDLRRSVRDLHREGEISWCVAFSPDGRTLAAGSGRAVVRFDVESGAELSRSEVHAELVSGVAYHPDGSRLASVDMDGELVLWADGGAGEPVSMHRHNGRLHDVAFSPDGTRLVVASSSSEILVWELDGSRGATPRPPDRRLGGHVSPAWAVAFDRDGRYLASGSQNGRVILREASGLTEIATFTTDVERVRSLAFDRDGSHLAVGCYHDMSLCLDLATLRGVLAELGLDWDDPPPGR